MANKKTYQIIAQRMAVNVLETNRPDLEEESLSENDKRKLISEYNKIIDKIEKVATKNGGKFNRFSFF